MTGRNAGAALGPFPPVPLAEWTLDRKGAEAYRNLLSDKAPEDPDSLEWEFAAVRHANGSLTAWAWATIAGSPVVVNAIGIADERCRYQNGLFERGTDAALRAVAS